MNISISDSDKISLHVACQLHQLRLASDGSKHAPPCARGVRCRTSASTRSTFPASATLPLGCERATWQCFRACSVAEAASARPYTHPRLIYSHLIHRRRPQSMFNRCLYTKPGIKRVVLSRTVWHAHRIHRDVLRGPE